ncbi:hypothetical protein HY383_00535 [Candidatus Daviesbacteria bacterium]|nr:hypothetical protein [Candidatus Daviesbacteria bacterium]
MPNLPFDPTTLLLILGLIITAILYLREYNLRNKLETNNEKVLEKIKEQSWSILHDSTKKSNAILGQAELEGIKVVAGSKVETAKFEQSFSKELSEAVGSSKQVIVNAQNQLLEFMKDLQTRSAEFEEASKHAGEQRINQLFDRFEQRLADFLVQTEQKTTSSIELELKSTRALIEIYKNEQLKLIDENIIAMMEQTLSIVLAKKLSLKDQLDLVYEALEKAKVEKFIV